MYTAGMIKKYLAGDFKSSIPHECNGLVDVRDVALMHVRAITVPEAQGHRYIAWAGGFWKKQVADMLRKEYEPKGWTTIGTTEGTNPNAEVNYFDVSPAEQILGIQWIPMERTVVENAEAWINNGLVTKQ